jgi:putative addiction module component (TIGR02574 family)
MSLSQITPSALLLPAHERAALAESLWESLEDPYTIPGRLNDAEALYLAIERDAEIESGKVSPLTHQELMRRLRR